MRFHSLQHHAFRESSGCAVTRTNRTFQDFQQTSIRFTNYGVYYSSVRPSVSLCALSRQALTTRLRNCSTTQELASFIIRYQSKFTSDQIILASEALLGLRKDCKDRNDDLASLLDRLLCKLQAPHQALTLRQITRCLVCLTKTTSSNKSLLCKAWIDQLLLQQDVMFRDCSFSTLSHLSFAVSQLPDAHNDELLDSIADYSTKVLLQQAEGRLVGTSEIAADGRGLEMHKQDTNTAACQAAHAACPPDNSGNKRESRESCIWARHVGQLLWSFAAAHHWHQGLINALITVLPCNCAKMHPSAVVQVLWALVVFDSWHVPVVEALAREICAKAVYLPPQELATCTWAFAALKLPRNHHVFHVLFQALSTSTVKDHSDVSLRQLHQAAAMLMSHAQLAAVASKRPAGEPTRPASNLGTTTGSEVCLEHATDGCGDVPQLPLALRLAAEASWKLQLQRVNVSAMQLDVFQILKSMALAVQMEHVTHDGMMSIDIAVKWKDAWYALEVDGPLHFFHNVQTKPLGTTSIRDWMLHARAWRVAKVAYYDWDELATQPQKQQFLVKLLDSASAN